MNVSLTPTLEDLINRKVASGLYNSASEVVREGLRLLEERDQRRELRLQELKKQIAAGVEQIEGGQYTEYDSDSLNEMFDQVKTNGRKKLEQGSQRRRA